jgi:hypothetical protein
MRDILVTKYVNYLWALYGGGLTYEPTNRLDVERCTHIRSSRHTFQGFRKGCSQNGTSVVHQIYIEQPQEHWSDRVIH